MFCYGSDIIMLRVKPLYLFCMFTFESFDNGEDWVWMRRLRWVPHATVLLSAPRRTGTCDILITSLGVLALS